MKIFIISLVCILIFGVNAYPVEISLKLSGGLNYLKLANINSSLESWKENLEKEALFHKNWSFIEGKANKFHTGTSFETELLIAFNSRLATSISMGYIYGEQTGDQSEVTIEKKEIAYNFNKQTIINTIPLYFSVYYYFLTRDKMNLFVKGGAGYTWAKYIERDGQKQIKEEIYKYPDELKAKAESPVYQASLGFEYQMDESMDFFIEACYRFAEINSFKEDTEEDPGNLYYFEEYNPDLDFWQSKFQIFKNKPSGKNYRSISDEIIDFSGFSIKLGVKIRL
ncbi:MAG: DUF481 domain-containing protein [Candidatus Aminicenantaceae bacterium]